MEDFRRFEEGGWQSRAASYHRVIGRIAERAVDPLLDAAAVGAGGGAAGVGAAGVGAGGGAAGVGAAGVGAGPRVLDLACGPGYAAARAADRGAAVTGVDLSPAMVELSRAQYPGIDFRAAPAEALPFGAGAFDAVVANFLLPHLADPAAVVAECARVLAPGGRLALSVWDRPERARFVGVLVEAVAEVGAVPPAGLPAGPPFFQFAEPAAMVALYESAGFTSIDVRAVAFEQPLAAADELWHGLLGGTVRTSALVLAQPATVRERIRAAFDRLVAPYMSGDGLSIPVSVVLASGIRSAS